MTGTQPNTLRPATAIIRKLAGPSSQLAGDSIMTKTVKGRNKGKGRERANEPDSPRKYGYGRFLERMRRLEADQENGVKGISRFFGVVVKRLEGTGDLEVVAESLSLINSCLMSADQENHKQYPELVSILEGLSIRRCVSRLMPICSSNIVEPQILRFQSCYIIIIRHHLQRPVRPTEDPQQERMLADIWTAGRLDTDIDDRVERLSDEHGAERSWEGWQKIGLYPQGEEAAVLAEDELFPEMGELGLECLVSRMRRSLESSDVEVQHWFAMHQDSFRNDIMEQQARSEDRQCPIGRASAECVKILCEHYKVSSNQIGSQLPPSFQLFLLNFPRLHSLVLRFFMRMWQESESRLADFERVSLLVLSQIRVSLHDEASKTWLHLEHDFLEADYRTIRDRQMEVLEREDGMLNRPAIRDLREKLSREAYEVMAEQRIGCMLQGSCFNSAIVIDPAFTSSIKPNQTKPLRFLRLSPNRRTLAWDEFGSRMTIPPTYESLRERIDVANITEVRMATGCAIGSRSPNLVSKLSFSLMAGNELSMLDLDAVHAAQLAEWTDGVRILREGAMASQDSANYVHILTELALKVRLLDITGDRVDLPEKVSYGMAPRSVDFWFAK